MARNGTASGCVILSREGIVLCPRWERLRYQAGPLKHCSNRFVDARVEVEHYTNVKKSGQIYFCWARIHWISHSEPLALQGYQVQARHRDVVLEDRRLFNFDQFVADLKSLI